jgi:hypothetical protein
MRAAQNLNYSVPNSRIGVMVVEQAHPDNPMVLKLRIPASAAGVP